MARYVCICMCVCNSIYIYIYTGISYLIYYGICMDMEYLNFTMKYSWEILVDRMVNVVVI